MTLKSFCETKDSINRIKWQPTEWEKIFTNPISDRGQISKIDEELKMLGTNKKITHLKVGLQS